jgi:hypothetical protein
LSWRWRLELNGTTHHHGNTMTDQHQHRATSIQWERVNIWARDDGNHACHCLLELRDRIAALEAAQASTRGILGNSPAGSDAPAIAEPLRLTNDEALDMYFEVCKENTYDCVRRIYGAGWKAAIAANFKPTSNDPQIRSSSPAGSLVERVMTAIERADGDHEARAAIREVAEWLRERSEWVGSGMLEQEATNG